MVRIDATGMFAVCRQCGTQTPYQETNSENGLRLPPIEHPDSRNVR
jgi:hypothetical protein